MAILQLSHIFKSYNSGSNKQLVLDDISISFDYPCLVGIIGKSGCGKSTLLNVISSYDKPDSGGILFNGEDITKFNNKKVNNYRCKNIGFVFQHYNLIPDLTVLENVALPMMVSGENTKRCFEDAKTLLESIKLPPNLYDRLCSNLSGGEQQRIATLRALINDPNIILADEPTGALDSSNSEYIMSLLKKASKKKLVIVVSHNEELIEKYADRIITIKKNKIFNDAIISEKNDEYPIVKKCKKQSSTKWPKMIARKNLKKKKNKFIFSLLSLIISFTSSLLSFGFINGSKLAVENQTKRHLDNGVASIDKFIRNEDTGPSIYKTFRPTKNELENEKENLKDFNVCNNYDYYFPRYQNIKIFGTEFYDISINPIYSFDPISIDESLLLEGRFPLASNFTECVVNNKAKEKLIKEIGRWNVEVEFLCSKRYVFNNETTSFDENISFKHSLKIVGIVDELEFLNTPKLYYSYSGLESFLVDFEAEAATKEFGHFVSLADLVSNSSSSDEIGSYSYILFAKNINNFSLDKTFNNPNIELTSYNNDISNSIIELIDSTSDGIFVFALIIILGACFICAVINYSNFIEEKRTTSILKTFGTTKSERLDVFAYQAIISGVISGLISIIFSIILEPIINWIIQMATGFKYVIKIPWFDLLGISWLFLAIVGVLILSISFLTCAMPIALSPKISITKELADE